MDLSQFVEHCRSLPGAEECTPFGPEVLVFKVGGKMFALTRPGEHPERVNLKCDPERAMELRDRYDAVTGAYHMNKRHWNTLILNGSLPGTLVRELLEHSYALVVRSLPVAKRP